MADEMEFAPPKYAQIVQALRRRIADGTYPPGAKLPSETQLQREFGVARPTVVRALQTMELRGEIDREHGRGSFVKALPATAASERSRPARSVLSIAEADEPGVVIAAEQRPAPAGVARLLGVAEQVPVWLRQRITHTADTTGDTTDTADNRADDTGEDSAGDRADDAVGELVSLWSTVETARAAGLDQAEALTTNVRQLIQAGTGSRVGHVTERLTARRPTAGEAKLLNVARNACVLAVLASVFDTGGRPLLVAELVLPGERYELEDSYPL
jgi:GntR family transcriptional regulator